MRRLTCGSLYAPAGHPVLNPWLRLGAAWARPRRRSQQTRADGRSLTSSCTDVGFNNIKPRLPEVWGTRQTEIDAAIALRPDDLDRIAREAITPFFDETLAGRTEEAAQDWLANAQEIIDDGLDGNREQLLAVAEDKLGRARTLIDEVGESLKTTAELGDLPEFEPPEPAVPVGDALPSGTGTTLVSSEWEFPEQCRALKQSKAHGGDEAEDEDEDEAPEES